MVVMAHGKCGGRVISENSMAGWMAYYCTLCKCMLANNGDVLMHAPKKEDVKVDEKTWW